MPQYNNFKIESGAKRTASAIDASTIGAASDGRVNVSMKYYQKGYECLSKWTKPEIASFSSWLVKMAERTPSQVTSVTKTCHRHQGKPAQRVPAGLSPDVSIYGLDVGPKQRVHGAFVGESFFVIWLDREHRFHK